MLMVGILAIKVVLGGLAVVVFSLIAEGLKPKAFAGLFAAAPSVAVASLLVGYYATGPAKTVNAALGMLAGAAGMIACCGVAAIAMRRTGAVLGSAASWAAWAVVAGGLYFLVVARL